MEPDDAAGEAIGHQVKPVSGRARGHTSRYGSEPNARLMRRKDATLRQAQGRLLRAARPDPSLRKERLLGMTMRIYFLNKFSNA